MRKIIFIIMMMCSVISYGYTTSTHGKQFIKNKEGFSLTAYKDADGYSVGWGHHKSDVKRTTVISHAQAQKYFNDDIKIAENAANRIISSLPYKYKFSQSFFDGMVSMIYNMGEGAILTTDFYKRLTRCRVKNGKINKNDFDYTLAGVLTSNANSKGHKDRRKEEMKLMKA